MKPHLEPFATPTTSLAQWRADFTGTALGNAFIGFVFAASGPLAVILSVGTRGGLDAQTLSSWVFGAFFINGLLTIAACWLYRTPLVFFWTIPGTVLVGPALDHLSFAQVVGAFYVTGLLMLVLGWLGALARIMKAIPMPIVMGMVAGVFIQFGIGWVDAVRNDFPVAGPMTVAFVLLTAVPALGRRLPPLIGALLIGALVIALTDRMQAGDPLAGGWLGLPEFVAPAFSWQAMFELVVPLAITVLMVQNAQGFAVLQSADHQPPVNAVTIGCGAFSMLTATVGTVSTCLTGPTSALITSSGARSSHWVAGTIVGLFALVFGLVAPGAIGWMLAAPPAFVATLAGLAMLRVLQAAFATAFGTRYQLGALVSLVVTVSGISIANIGAPFWGLVFGFVLSWLMERADHRVAAK